MTFSLIVTLIVLLLLVVLLTQEFITPEVSMLSALLVLVACGVITTEEALAGFANPAIITIAAMFVIGAGLQSTGGIETLSALLLGRPKPGTPLLRLIAPVSFLSAMMNNTPLVAFFLPIFIHTAKKLRISPSKLLIPLSYAAVMGGTCTLIGTSTNFVIDGALRQQKLDGLGMFELGCVGIPITIVGLLFLVTFGQRLLPDRVDLLEYAETHPREYTAELIVQGHCPLAGKTIRDSGLRDLPGLYLYAIERTGERLSPVSPQERILIGDLLCFSGIVATIVDVQKTRGLEPVEHHSLEKTDATVESLDSFEGVPLKPAPRSGSQLCEVVISASSPLIGQTVKEIDFRTHYHASIVAVHRSGEKLEHKIGQIVLQSGDTLLVDAPADFAKRWRNSREFILVSGLEDSAPVEHTRAGIALAILLCVVVGMTFFTSFATIIALAGAALIVITGCVPAREAHRSIELPILLLIASALGVSKALDTSGAADQITRLLLSWAQPFGHVAILAAIVILTGVLTELLSNNACAALMATFALATAKQTGMDPRPLLIAVAVTSSYGFATPIGYQTNLMVMNPGGYKFSDYLRVGIPLDIICWTLTIILIPLIWKL